MMENQHNSRPELVGAHDTGPTGTKPPWDKLRPMNVGDSCKAWSVSGVRSSGTRPIPDA